LAILGPKCHPANGANSVGTGTIQHPIMPRKTPTDIAFWKQHPSPHQKQTSGCPLPRT
jgi:hypothetical protein